MPSTYPISMKEVRTNGAGLYVSMFFASKKIDAEGTAVDQFYWVRSNSTGDSLDERDNKIPVNGASWWGDKATALANVPVGYDGTEVESNFENEKVLSFLAPFPTDNYERVQLTKNALGAFSDIGGNGFILELRWENVFKNITQQNTNADSSWAWYDEIIEHAKNKGLKVSLRICVDMDDGTLNVNGTGTAFYGLDNQAKDEWGYVGRIEYGFGHCSLNYPTGTAMIFDFVQKVVTRYSDKLGSQFYWYSVTTTAQRESGYNYENQNFDIPGRPLYKALFDYSTHAHAAFKSWCQTKYTTIDALKTSWGTTEFGSFNDITMPKSGLSSPGTTSEQPFLDVFKTNKGKDWWQFTYETIKAFQTTCYNMRPSGVKYFLEYGSCSDIMSALRYSCFISNAATYSDGLKAQFSGFSAQRDLSFSLDVIRSNYSKKKGTEVSWADIYSDNPDRPSQYGATQVSQIKDIAVQLAKTAIDSQAKEIIIIAEYSRPAVFQAMMEATTEIKAYLNNFNGETPIVANATYKLGEVLNNYGSVIQRWRDASGDTNRRINFVQSPTIDYDGVSTGGGGGGGEDESPNSNIFSLYPISRYNIKDNSLKSLSVAQYGTDGRPSYDIPNTFVLELPTHSINYLDEFLARSTIKVVGSDGLEYLRTTQFDGVFTRGEKTEGQLAYIASNYPSAKFAEDGYSNNHPNRYYTGTGGDDAVFVLPYNDSSLTWYDVTIKNTGASTILFDVYNPDQSMGPLVNFRNHAVTAGSSYTYRINVSAIRDYPWWLRTVKVNNNRRN